MTLYARADVSYVCVPRENGGCGEPHSRPVTHGAPAKQFVLDCVECEKFLRADIARTGNKKVRTVNADYGMKLAERYLGQWGASPETVPETPDAEKQREWTQDRTALENAATQSEAFGQIAKALEGNQQLLLKFAEMFAAQQAPASLPEPSRVLAEPLPEALRGVDPSTKVVVGSLVPVAESHQCLDCDALIVRREGQRGALPQRCPDCKAKKAAARRKAA